MNIPGNKNKTELRELVCPSCGANMEIDYDKQVIVCPYCGAKEVLVSDGKIQLNNEKKTKKKIKKPSRGVLRFAIIAVAFILIVSVFAMLSSTHHSRHVSYDWPDSGLATMIPDPYAEYGEIHTDYSDAFSMDAYGYKPDGFRSYVSACKEKGFTVDEKLEDNSFEAYNEDGYHLEVYLYAYDDDLYIRLETPVVMSAMDWGSIDAFALLPVPKSDLGCIEWEYSDSARVRVGNTTKEEFHEYVKECKAAGFSRDLTSYDDYYYADYKDGNQHLTVSFDGFNIMTVSLSVYD